MSDKKFTTFRQLEPGDLFYHKNDTTSPPHLFVKLHRARPFGIECACKCPKDYTFNAVSLQHGGDVHFHPSDYVIKQEVS